MSSQVDEETPLLSPQKQKKTTRTPLPWFQFSLVLFLQLAEPLTSQVIYPFTPEVCLNTLFIRLITDLLIYKQLIRELGITHGNESKVGYYVGLMVSRSYSSLCNFASSLSVMKQSLFFLTQAFTVLHWSSASDRVGRKPVILIGLFGLSLSMYCFGLSRTFWGLVLR
jgi:MFS family permease